MPDGTCSPFPKAVPIASALPPLTLPGARSRPDPSADLLPRLGRIACVLAALALPTFGIAVADTVHRAGEPRVSQAAALVDPPERAAALPGHRLGEAR